MLLTADVSFLAVPNVMPNNGIPQGQAAPPAVVATQISLIAAMGSIVVGLLLVREHRKKASESAQVAVRKLVTLAQIRETKFHTAGGFLTSPIACQPRIGGDGYIVQPYFRIAYVGVSRGSFAT